MSCWIKCSCGCSYSISAKKILYSKHPEYTSASADPIISECPSCQTEHVTHLEGEIRKK